MAGVGEKKVAIQHPNGSEYSAPLRLLGTYLQGGWELVDKADEAVYDEFLDLRAKLEALRIKSFADLEEAPVAPVEEPVAPEEPVDDKKKK